MVKVAINGFGRIGRIFFRQAFGHSDLDIVAINDLGSPENLAYLLKYDSVYGRYEREVGVDGNKLVVGPAWHEASQGGKHEILVLSEKDPAKLPWASLEIDIVVESTGMFDSRDKASVHLDAGAKRVIITAPAKDEITPVSTPNVNERALKLDKITSNASCTTNAVTPVLAVLIAELGIKKAMLNTVHAYTSLQNLVDGPDRRDKFARGRAGAFNIVPYLTGAATATTKAIPELNGRFDGIALRVPVPSGSIMDFTFLAARVTTIEEVNSIFKKAAGEEQWKGILTVTEDPIVSTDVLGQPYGSIVDLSMTRVVDGDLVKVLAWYDNEWGYCAMLLRHLLTVSKLIE